MVRFGHVAEQLQPSVILCVQSVIEDLPPLADLSDWESLRVQLNLPEVEDDAAGAPEAEVTELPVASAESPGEGVGQEDMDEETAGDEASAVAPVDDAEEPETEESGAEAPSEPEPEQAVTEPEAEPEPAVLAPAEPVAEAAAATPGEVVAEPEQAPAAADGTDPQDGEESGGEWTGVGKDTAILQAELAGSDSAGSDDQPSDSDEPDASIRQA